jgi:hypothetical protein
LWSMRSTSRSGWKFGAHGTASRTVPKDRVD